MDIWIKDLSDRSQYTRFGKIIPKKETKVDMIEYFGRDVLSQLKSDKNNMSVIVHNSKDLDQEKKEAKQKEDNADKNKKINITNLSNEDLKKLAKEKNLRFEDDIKRQDLIKLVRDN
jgi:hypothetical protein